MHHLRKGEGTSAIGKRLRRKGSPLPIDKKGASVSLLPREKKRGKVETHSPDSTNPRGGLWGKRWGGKKE